MNRWRSLEEGKASEERAAAKRALARAGKQAEYAAKPKGDDPADAAIKGLSPPPPDVAAARSAIKDWETKNPHPGPQMDSWKPFFDHSDKRKKEVGHHDSLVRDWIHKEVDAKKAKEPKASTPSSTPAAKPPVDIDAANAEFAAASEEPHYEAPPKKAAPKEMPKVSPSAAPKAPMGLAPHGYVKPGTRGPLAMVKTTHPIGSEAAKQEFQGVVAKGVSKRRDARISPEDKAAQLTAGVRARARTRGPAIERKWAVGAGLMTKPEAKEKPLGEPTPGVWKILDKTKNEDLFLTRTQISEGHNNRKRSAAWIARRDTRSAVHTSNEVRAGVTPGPLIGTKNKGDESRKAQRARKLATQGNLMRTTRDQQRDSVRLQLDTISHKLSNLTTPEAQDAYMTINAKDIKDFTPKSPKARQ